MLKSNYIGFLAMLLGLAALYPKYYKISKTKNIDSFSKNAVIISILSGLLWFIYHVRESQHLNVFNITIYMILDIYLLTFFK